jgi:NAD(P)-dependent dehydrogenase (short-subunit alcohol dehydrogenase family)
MANKSKEVKRQPRRSAAPGREHKMIEQPVFVRTDYRGSDKLAGKVAIITGGDSGIGRAVAVAYAKEGADLVIVFRDEDTDAKQTQILIEAEHRRCLLMRGDIGQVEFCKRVVDQTIKTFGRLDVLINNAAEQHPQESITDITPQQLQRTFQTNIFAMFYLVSAALPHLRKQGGCIINTTSVTAFRGSAKLLDYSSTKGAILSFTRSLSESLAKEGIRVNAVAPGPIWTPLITSTFDAEKVESFGKDVPLGRAGQPYECAGAYVFLASADATYVTGQTIHVNGGEVVNA